MIKLLNKTQLATRFGCGAKKLREIMASADFPHPIYLSATARPVWREEDIEAWVASK